MTRTASTRITAAAALAVISTGLLTGGIALATPTTANLADYGAAITADDASNEARARGVPHTEDSRHSPEYFKEMDGGDKEIDGGGR